MSDVASRYYSEKVVAGCENYKSYELQYLMGSSVCNEAWRNAKVQKVNYIVKNINPANLIAEEGIQSPVITLTDYAGNTAKVNSTGTGASYSPTARSWSTDWRLFIDSTVPDKQNIDTNIWKDGKDGVSADGITPEVDRLPVTPISPTGEVARWVIRGNTITLKLRGEKYTRALIENQIVNATNTNCSVVGTPVTKNNLVVKSNEICDLSFTYTWTGTGAQDEYGQANDQKLFRYNLMDLAGNYSATSDGVTIYNDKTAPAALVRSVTSNGGEIVDRYIRTNKVTDISYGEQKADVEYQLTKNGVVQSTRVQRMGDSTNTSGVKQGTLQAVDCTSGKCVAVAQTDNYKTSADFTIGANVTDDVVGCVQVINGKRTGICSDGIYEIKARQADTSGNYSVQNTKVLERDTVAPSAGTLTIDKVGNTLGVTISGEAGATGVVTVSSAAGTKTREYSLTGSLQSIPNVLGYEMQCGGIGYGVSLRVRDAAGNLSTAVTQSTSTADCVVCSAFDVIDKSTGKSIVIAESGIWLNPLRGQTYTSIPGSEFGAPRVYNGVNYPHEGLDEQAAVGTPVKATRSGIVIESGSNGGKGNYVLIDHLDGYQSQYLHFSERNVVIGQVVDESTVIGKVGLTGNTDGEHLHFDILKNGRNVNPALYLTKSNMKENAVIISENADYKLVRYGGNGNCNVPLTLPPVKGTTVGNTGGASIDGDDWFVSDIDDFLKHRVNYELDPSAYIKNNYNELVDIIKKQSDPDLKALSAISKTLNCLSLLNPVGINAIAFINSVQDCFSLSNVDWNTKLKSIVDSLPYLGKGFSEGYWSGVKNIWEGPMGLFASGDPSTDEIVNEVLILSMLWGLTKGGVQCVFSLFTNCSMMGESMEIGKMFLMKFVSLQWDAIKQIWAGIIGIPKLIEAIIKGANDMYSFFESGSDKLASMILFPVTAILTGISSDITREIVTTSLLMSGTILEKFKEMSVDGRFIQTIKHHIGFVIGIFAELATEQAVLWGINALADGVATSALILKLGDSVASAFNNIFKVLKFVASMALFDSVAVFSILKNMYTLRTWNVLRAAGISLAELKQFGKNLILEVRAVDGKIVMLWEDLLKYLKLGEESQVAGMINRDRAFARSLIQGLNRYEKAVEDLLGTSSILFHNNIHSKWGEVRWSEKWNKYVLDGIHEWDLIDKGVVTYTKSTSKLKYTLSDGRVMDWMQIEGIVAKDVILGDIPKINDASGLPGMSGMFPKLMTTAEKDSVKLNITNQLLNELTKLGDGKLFFQPVNGSADLGYLKFSNDLTNKYFTYLQEGHKIEFRVFFNNVTKEIISIQPAKFTY